MRRRLPPLLVSLPVWILVGSCIGTESPTGVDGRIWSIDIPIAASLIPSPADAGALPINRIRARAARVSDDATLGEAVVDVSPTDAEWEVLVDATVGGGDGTVEVMVYVLLINASGGTESVQFSGRVGPVMLTAGERADVPDVPIVRGPLENLSVTGVTITAAPDTLLQGAAAVLRATASTAGSAPPSIFWTVLDSAVLSSADSTVTALTPGTGRIVASAGSFADTTSIVVTPAADLVMAKSAAVSSAQEGDTVDFEITVTNAGPGAVSGAVVSDSLPTGLAFVSAAPAGTFDPASATWRWSLGALASGAADTIALRALVGSGTAGTSLVNTSAVAPPAGVTDPDPTNDRSTATLSVTLSGVLADLALTKTASSSTVQEGDTVDFTLVATNPGQIEAVGATVTDSLPTGLTYVSSTPPATLDQATGRWSWVLDTLVVGGADSVAMRVTVDAGTANSALPNRAWITAPAGLQDGNPSNDIDGVVLEVAPPPPLDVAVLKTVDEPQPLADSTVLFTVSVVNHGPDIATGLVVFDTLASTYFTAPQHAVSVGSLVGDSLWTIPTLAVGDTATWSSTTVVASGAAGSSASNTAILRTLDQTDGTPANDTAVVAMTFPLSAIPVVVISSPADSSVFDPGVAVDFIAAANDAEDGSLTPSIQWRSDVDGALGTGRIVSTSTLSTGVHTISASATDSDGGTGADTITVTIALITTPTALNVPFGGSASLPISLTEGAPAGGITLAVSSLDPSITSPTSSTVFIAGGATSANATLQGLQPGTTDVTVSHAQYGSSTTSVSVTAALNIAASTLTVPQTFPQDIDVRLESQGSGIAAPPGGLAVTLTAADPTCASVASSITIPGGLISRTTSVSYGGSAQLQCQTYVYATAPGITTDSVRVFVNAIPSFSIGATTVGAGLQYGLLTAALGTTTHGGVTVRIESEDPSILLVAPNASSAGTPFIDVPVPNGQNQASYYLQGVEGTTGTSSLVVSAPGFATDSALITIVQPAFDIVSIATTQNASGGEDPFTVRVGIPDAQLAGLTIPQAVRFGGDTLDVDVASSSPNVAQLVTLTDSTAPVRVRVVPGQSQTPGNVAGGGVALRPDSAGSTTVTATIAGLAQTANAVRTVTVSVPGISTFASTVGSGLQRSAPYALLQASQHGGVTVRVESADPSLVLVSPDATTLGTPFIDVPLPNGQTRVDYYVHALEGQTGVVPVRVTALGFATDSSLVTVVQPAYEIVSLSPTTTSLSVDDPFVVRLGIPYAQLTSLQEVQAVRIGGSAVSVSISSSNTQVGDLVTLPDSASPVQLQIAPGASSTAGNVATGGVAFDPVGAGTTTVAATIAGFVQTAISSVDVTVTAPGISVSSQTVGAGLQYGLLQASLLATNHGGVTARVESSDPALMLVSANDSTPGSAFIDVQVAAGATAVTYYLHGIEGTTNDTAQVRVSAPGFVTDSAAITIQQPGYEIVGLPTGLTTFAPDDAFQVRVGIPYPQNTSLWIVQSVRAGAAPVDVTITNSNSGAGQLATQSTTSQSTVLQIAPRTSGTPSVVSSGGVAFDPLGNGATNVTASIPAYAATAAATVGVTVSAPAITVSPSTVGSGLQYGLFNATLGASQHNGVTVTLASSNPSVLRLSPDAVTPGTDTIRVFVPNGSSGASYYVQGMEGATGDATITASASGFTDGTAVVSVVQPAFDIQSVSPSYSAGAADDPFWAVVGVPYPGNTQVWIQQAVRAGGTGLTATFTSANPAAAQLTTTAGGPTSGSVVLAIAPGESRTPTTLATGGIGLDPVAAGATAISAVIPGLIATPLAAVAVTITP